jgi:hypothetical protein
MIVAFNQANDEEKAAIIGTLIGSTIDPFSKLKGLKFARMMRGSGRYTIKIDIDVPNNRLDNVIEGAGSTGRTIPNSLNEQLGNGGKGDGGTPFVSLEFWCKDKLGHVIVEVYMEIDDGASYDKHNCCFFIKTETGLLNSFGKSLSLL